MTAARTRPATPAKPELRGAGERPAGRQSSSFRRHCCCWSPSSIYPAISTLRISLDRGLGGGYSNWVGFDNWVHAVHQDPKFLRLDSRVRRV